MEQITKAQLEAKAKVRADKRQRSNTTASNLKSRLTNTAQRSMELTQEKGASCWLTALPIEQFGFHLHKRDFRDALALRYGWLPSQAPTHCTCGKSFTVKHALSCPKGGFPSIRHNEVRDLTATLLTEVCHNVSIEPDLQPLTGEQLSLATSNRAEGARLDVAANGFWGGRYEHALFDVKVFNPYAPSYRHTLLPALYRQQENMKKRAYEQRVLEVEHASFTPLVMSLTGGLSKAANSTYKRLASLFTAKWNSSYSSVMGWLRCRLMFSLLRSSIMCIRGARSSSGHAAKPLLSVDLMTAESQVAIMH